MIYAIIRIAPQRWWMIAWAVFVGLFLLIMQLAPVVLFPLFYKFEPLNNDALRDRLTRLGQRAGTRVRGVYEWKLSEKSKKANAALMGIGATRRIILADTLLQNYTDDEIEAVLAHELGHHVRRHILWGIFTQVAITFFGFWLTDQVLRFALGHEWFPVARNAPLRLRQPAADHSRRHRAGLPADARTERALAPPRTRSRSVRMGEHSRPSAPSSRR